LHLVGILFPHMHLAYCRPRQTAGLLVFLEAIHSRYQEAAAYPEPRLCWKLKTKYGR